MNRLAFCLAVTILLAAAPAHAQVRRMVEVEAAGAQPPRTITLPENQFEMWTFGNGRTADGVHKQLELLLMAKIADITRTCELTAEQRKKLFLAGQGDIKHFFDVVNKYRRRYVNVPIDQIKFNQVVRDLQAMQAPVNQNDFTLLPENQLLQKSLAAALAPDQLARYQSHIADTLAFQHRAKIELVVAMLDEGMGFTGDQRKRLTELLTAETKPPQKWTSMDFYFTLYQASNIPAEKFSTILDEAQWRFLKNLFEMSKRYEPTFRQQGLLPTEATDRPAAFGAPGRR